MHRWMASLAVLLMAVVAVLWLWLSPTPESEFEAQEIAAQSNALLETNQGSEITPNLPRDASAAVHHHPADQTGIVYGRVRFQQGQTPVAGAVVHLFPVSPELWKPTVWQGPKTRTDETGQFSFADIQPGRYTILARKDEWVSMEKRNQVDSFLLKPNQNAGPLALYLQKAVHLQVEVRDGASGLPIEAAAISFPDLPPVDSVTDAEGRADFSLTAEPWAMRVRARGYADQILVVSPDEKENPVRVFLAPGGRVLGQVRDRDGGEIEGAQVVLTSRVVKPQTSDRRGRFALEGVGLHQSYAIRAVKGINRSSRETIKLSVQEPVQYVDLILNRPIQGDWLEITGQVRDPQGMPIAAALVTANARWSEEEIISVVSDGDGRYAIRVPRDGHMRHLFAEARGFAPSRKPLKPFLSGQENFVVLDFTLAKGFWLAGKVVDASAAPLPEVAVQPVWEEYSLNVATITYTDEEGRFRLDSLPGEARFHFFKSGYSPQVGRAFPLNTDDVEVVLEDPGSLIGSVSDGESGEPVTRFNLRVKGGMHRSRALFSALGDQGLTVSHPQGHFQIDDLVAGRKADLIVSADGYMEEVLSALEIVPASRAEEVRIELAKAGVVYAGRVQNLEGNPMADAQLHLLVAAGKEQTQFGYQSLERLLDPGQRFQLLQNLSGKTDEQGRFRFEDVHTDLPAALFIEAEGYGKKTMTNLEKLTQDQRENITVFLEPAGRLHIQINRERIAGEVFVQLYNRSGGDQQSLDIPAEKAEHFVEQLSAGDYNAWAYNPNNEVEHFRTDRFLTITAGNSAVLALGFERQPDFSGLIYWNGDPLPLARVGLRLDNSGRHRYTNTDPAGRFFFENLKPGTYQLHVFPPESAISEYDPFGHHNSKHRFPVVLSDEDVYREFHVEDGSGLSGRFEPVPQHPWTVSLIQVAGGGGFSQSQGLKGGEFHFPAVSQGVFALRLQNTTKHPAIDRLVMTEIQVPGDQRVDLGTLPFPSGPSGIHLVVQGEKPPAHVSTTLSLSSTQAANQGQALLYGSFPGNQQSVNFDALPAGTYRVELKVHHPAWTLEPTTLDLKLEANHQKEITLQMIPLTWLQVRAYHKTMTAAAMTATDSTIYTFSQPRGNQLPTPNAQNYFLELREQAATASNLPEGQYILEIKFQEENQPVQMTVILKKGELINLRL